METKRIDGKKIAESIRKAVAQRVAARKKSALAQPALATILIGEDPASEVYVRNKHRSCAEAGIDSISHTFSKDVEQKEIQDLINALNADPKIHGILMQLPIPSHLDEKLLIGLISPDKDVDGIHPINAGLLAQKNRQPKLAPATPSGIMRLLEIEKINLTGLHAVVLGRSNIVGIPVAAMLLKANATVTICHSRTKNLEEICQQADVLIAAVGIPELVKQSWVKAGAIIIDVGVNRVEDASKKRGYRLVGDVAYDEMIGKVSAITPVPGGVGPMTIAMLLENTLIAAENAD